MQEIERALLKIRKLFDRLGLTFWLSGGQVLGLIRDGGFLANEHDIDLGIYGEDVGMVYNKLRDEQIVVDLRMTDKGKVRCLKLKINGIGVDIFVFHCELTNAVVERYAITHCEGFGYAYHCYPEEIFRNLKKVKFLGESFLIPNPPETYLELEYGNWKTKKEKWNCCENPPCVRREI